MTIWVFTYDLRNVEGSQDYKPLWKELERLGAHRAQESQWLLDLTDAAKVVVDHFKGFVHKDDRLWVSELTKNHYYTNAMSGTNDWLKKHPPAR